MTFADFQILGCYACSVFAGWEIGNLLRVAWPRLVGREPVPLDYSRVLLPRNDGYQPRLTEGFRRMGEAARAGGITLTPANPDAPPLLILRRPPSSYVGTVTR